jgi:hypothetical protein
MERANQERALDQDPGGMEDSNNRLRNRPGLVPVVAAGADQELDREQVWGLDQGQELDEDPGGIQDNNSHRNRPGLGLDLGEEHQEEARELERELDEDQEQGLDQDRELEQELDGDPGEIEDSNSHRIRPELGLDLDEEHQDEERALDRDRAPDGTAGKYSNSRPNRVHRRSYRPYSFPCRPCSLPYCLHW